ncbi:MAG: hypothetical protein ACTHK7_23015 [Aureliella sp.]
MKNFRPVDHKESDPQYVAEVRKWVEQRAGSKLLDEVDPQFLVGKWTSSIDYGHTEPFDYEFRADGTFNMPIAYRGPTANTWRIDGDHYIETSWSPPIPEYGIDEPTEGEERYRCAQLEDGRFAYWNGDSPSVPLCFNGFDSLTTRTS